MIHLPVLPISVLVPTRNSRQQLPAHVASVRALLPIVLEIVVVDSESADGTVDFLRAEFAGAPVRFLTHPPGLYESWNFGVNACAGEFVYIATVGDSITAEGLQQLAAAARRFKCDVVISPPKLVGTNGAPVKRRWPVFELIDALNLQTPAVLDSEATLLFAIAFMRMAILGSSASNLYRAETLRVRPFPTDFGHGGDVGWGLRHGAAIRRGVVPAVVSTFVFHPRAKREIANAGAMRVEESRAALAGARSAISPESTSLGERLCDAWQRLFELNQRRRQTSFWMLRPGAWRERASQRNAVETVTKLQRDALSRIRTRVGA